jgi:hypothetical protein
MSRPKETIPQATPTKFIREYIDDNGVRDVWKFDLDKNPNGPIEVETFYPKGSKHRDQILEEENAKLPLTKRKYNNPATGKMVNYYRAKQLGLI